MTASTSKGEDVVGRRSPFRVLSLGAGVQSTTLALMAARGEIGPMPDCAIFADTQSEPSKVYAHLDWLEKQLPFPVYRVTAGSLRQEIVGAMSGSNRMDARPPFFTRSGGMLRRQCTQDFKLIPIVRKVRELIGLKPRQRGPKSPLVEQWIGISKDEIFRMKPSRLSYIKHRWPLIEIEMTRSGCEKWCAVRLSDRECLVQSDQRTNSGLFIAQASRYPKSISRMQKIAAKSTCSTMSAKGCVAYESTRHDRGCGHADRAAA